MWTSVLNLVIPPHKHSPDAWLDHQEPVSHMPQNKREERKREREKEKERERERERENAREKKALKREVVRLGDGETERD